MSDLQSVVRLAAGRIAYVASPHDLWGSAAIGKRNDLASCTLDIWKRWGKWFGNARGKKLKESLLRIYVFSRFGTWPARLAQAHQVGRSVLRTFKSS